jgi:hypothetical protein
VMVFHMIEDLIPFKEHIDKTRMFRTLLKGQVLSYFEYHLMRMLEADNLDISENDLIELVLQYIGLEYTPNRAISVNKYHIRRPRCVHTSAQQFVEILNNLNHYLLIFLQNFLSG